MVSFEWSGSRYLIRGKSVGYSEFTAHAYEGRDWIVQGTTQKAPQRIEYGLARKLAGGVYQLVPIVEDDADAPTREKFCTKTRTPPAGSPPRSSCSCWRGRAPTRPRRPGRSRW